MPRDPKMVNTYRVVLCGKTGVGKTSIFRRMCGSGLDCPKECGKKTATDHECNITAEVEGVKIQLNLWDTAGLEEYATLTRSHFSRSQAVMIVYSVTDQDSLNQALELLNFAKIHAGGAYFILVTNKIDLDPTFKEDDLLASLPKKAFVLKFRTSALTGQGIREMLGEMAFHLFKKATPMKPIGRSCLNGCDGNSASYDGDAGVVRLEFEEDVTDSPRRRWRKCCST